MPVQFLSEADHVRLSICPDAIAPDDLNTYFQLSAEDLAEDLKVVRKLRGDTNRLGFARQHPITRALQEYGRLEKTIHILRWYADPLTRKRVSKQLNKGEALHALRKTIMFGGYGEVAGKEDEALDQQFACLNLVTNAVVVFNTVHIARIADELKQEGHDISDEDLARV